MSTMSVSLTHTKKLTLKGLIRVQQMPLMKPLNYLTGE
jgi:hypothetical protein